MSKRPGRLNGLRHLALLVPNLEECERFYVDVLGMEVLHRANEDLVYLTCGNDNLSLGRAHVPASGEQTSIITASSSTASKNSTPGTPTSRPSASPCWTDPSTTAMARAASICSTRPVTRSSRCSILRCRVSASAVQRPGPNDRPAELCNRKMGSQRTGSQTLVSAAR